MGDSQSHNLDGLPAGTVTFLFTDNEGSTNVWQQYMEQMLDALARHHALLNEAIAAHGGYVFQIIGDAFCAARMAPNDLRKKVINLNKKIRGKHIPRIFFAVWLSFRVFTAPHK